MSFEKTTVYYDKNAELPHDFNWRIYASLHKDLKGFSETKLKQHYLLFGINENRPYKYEDLPTNTNTNNNNNNLNKNDFLNVDTFKKNNKATSNTNNSNYQILNEVLDDNYIINDLWCHVHSNNPSEVIHNELFIKLAKYFSVVFTCDNKTITNIPTDYTILCVNNENNIDTKEYVVDYLMDKKYNHDLLITMTY